MLQKAGWKEGEGLGKHGTGATEPLVVFKKRTRRGVGGESGASRVVVGEGEPDERPPGAGGGKPSAAAAAAAGAGGGGREGKRRRSGRARSTGVAEEGSGGVRGVGFGSFP
jgi:hypothetical protein